MLGPRSRLLAAIWCLCLAGCATHRVQLPHGTADSCLSSEDSPKLVVGVVEPPPDGFSVKNFDQALDSSVELIHVLRATECFAEVDFAKQLMSPPDLLLTVTRESGTEHWNLDGANGLLSIGTAFIIPTFDVATTTLAFTAKAPSGDDSTSFVFRAKSTELFGWLALLMAPLPDWSLGLSEWEANIDEIHFAVRSRHAELARISAKASEP